VPFTFAPLFSKVDLNKLWHNVQNEETLIYAKFGKDLFNISKVIGRKKVAQFFLTHSVQCSRAHMGRKYSVTWMLTSGTCSGKSWYGHGVIWLV